jgi:ascorbate-specific PTS system EIIC-type component UlaA
MFKFIEFLKKRPSDITIRILRTIGWGGLGLILFLTRENYTLPFASHMAGFEMYAKYTLIGLSCILMGVFGGLGLCVWKRSTMKKVQMLTGVLLILLGSTLSSVNSSDMSKCVSGAPGTKCASMDHVSETVSLSGYTPTSHSPVSPSIFLIWMGIFTLLGGIT